MNFLANPIPGSKTLPDIILAGTLILDFVASRIVKNKFLLFVNYLVHGLLLLQSEQTIIATMLIF